MKRKRTTKKKATAATPTIEIHTLVLVRMVIHRWRGRHIHKGLTNEIADSREADSDSISAIVKYMPSDTQEKIQQAARALRIAYKRYSLPWEDISWRVLRADQFDIFMKRIAKSRKDFQDVVDDVLENYDAIRKSAKKKLNVLFEDSKFPTRSKLSSLYGVDIYSSGIANPNDIRVNGLSKNREKEIRDSMQKQLQNKISEAIGHITKELRDMVEDSIKRYSKKEQDGVRYKGLQRSVNETCDYLETLNITGDPELSKLITITRHTLTKFKPVDLRVSEPVLNTAKKEAKKVMSALDNFGM